MTGSLVSHVLLMRQSPNNHARSYRGPAAAVRPDWNWPQIHKRCLLEARRLLRGHADAEEVVQEALTRAWRNQAACRNPESPMPWCLQITRNEALRLIGRRRANLGPLDDDANLVDERASGEGDVALARIDIDRALRALTAHERLLIELRYANDCSHPAIAARLGIPEATARVRLHRAHQRLRPLLR
jgi:RNA polymerase sigma-70 factor, ECF subfamily